MAKPRLFIGSSKEGLSVANALHTNLMKDAEATVWNQGIFELSTYGLESLLKALDDFDFGVFVLTPDDTAEIREESMRIPRDNVVFELGLFVGRLGRERSFIVTPDEKTSFHLASDLLGVNYAEYEFARSDGNMQAATGPAATQLRNAIGKVGPRLDSESESTVTVVEQSEAESDLASLTTEAGNISESQVTEDAWFDDFIDDRYQDALDKIEDQLAAPEFVPSTLVEDRRRLEVWKARMLYHLAPARGVAEFERLIAGEPSDYYPYLTLSSIHRATGRLRQSLQIADRGLIAVGKDFSPLVIAKARTLIELGRERSAITVLEDGITNATDESFIRTVLINQLIAMKDWKSAKKALLQACTALPYSIMMKEKLASFLYDHDDKDQALLIYDELIEADSDSPTYRTYRGNIFLEKELFDTALTEYEEATRLADDKQAWILSNMANLYRVRGLHTKAVFYFEKAVALDPQSAYAHGRLASAIESQSRERDLSSTLRREARVANAMSDEEQE